MNQEELEEMEAKHDEWREMKCDNSVRINGCADESPYHIIPLIEGPIGFLNHELWCSECTEDMLEADSFEYDEEEDEVVLISDQEYFPEAPEKIRASEAREYDLKSAHKLERNSEGELIPKEEEEDQ